MREERGKRRGEKGARGEGKGRDRGEGGREAHTRRSNFPPYRCCRIVSRRIAQTPRARRGHRMLCTRAYALLASFLHGCFLAKRINARVRAPHCAYARDTRRNVCINTRARARVCVCATRAIYWHMGEGEREAVNVYITFCKKATGSIKTYPSPRGAYYFSE